MSAALLLLIASLAQAQVLELGPALSQARSEVKHGLEERRQLKTWKSILLVFPNTDATYRDEEGRQHRYAGHLVSTQIAAAITAYLKLPMQAVGVTPFLGGIKTEVQIINEPIRKVSIDAEPGLVYWLAPEDIAAHVDKALAKGGYDSIFVLWKKGSIPSSDGWGRAAYNKEKGFTYAAVSDMSMAWKSVEDRQVWLHEWLHGVCFFFADRGVPMPEGDADGAFRHGYSATPETGWLSYYRDLMNAKVKEKDRFLGITKEAWLSATPSSVRTPK